MCQGYTITFACMNVYYKGMRFITVWSEHNYMKRCILFNFSKTPYLLTVYTSESIVVMSYL